MSHGGKRGWYTGWLFLVIIIILGEITKDERVLTFVAMVDQSEYLELSLNQVHPASPYFDIVPLRTHFGCVMAVEVAD